MDLRIVRTDTVECVHKSPDLTSALIDILRKEITSSTNSHQDHDYHKKHLYFHGQGPSLNIDERRPLPLPEKVIIKTTTISRMMTNRIALPRKPSGICALL
jgi:hypothetical protein